LVFRFSRRKSDPIGKEFAGIVRQAIKTPRTTWPEILWDLVPSFKFFTTTGVSLKLQNEKVAVACMVLLGFIILYELTITYL